MKKFKISCHSISKIMTGSIGLTEVQAARIVELETRKKDAANKVAGVKPLTANMEAELAGLITKRENPELPTGAKTFLKTWIKQKLFERKEEWKLLVVEKGLAVEQLGIEMVMRVLGIDGLDKNEEFFDNDYMHGFPDVLTNEMVRDIKSSWDLFTFPMFETKMPNEDYWWQLQGYMILTGRQKASVDYVLIDTPMPIILLDLKKLYYQAGGVAEEWTPAKYEALYPNYQFNDIPEKMRVKSFEVYYDSTVAVKIEQRVKMCREYIESILPAEVIKEVQNLKEAA